MMILISIIIITQQKFTSKTGISYSHQINHKLSKSKLGLREKDIILIAKKHFPPILPFSQPLLPSHPFLHQQKGKIYVDM